MYSMRGYWDNTRGIYRQRLLHFFLFATLIFDLPTIPTTRPPPQSGRCTSLLCFVNASFGLPQLPPTPPINVGIGALFFVGLSRTSIPSSSSSSLMMISSCVRLEAVEERGTAALLILKGIGEAESDRGTRAQDLEGGGGEEDASERTPVRVVARRVRRATSSFFFCNCARAEVSLRCDASGAGLTLKCQDRLAFSTFLSVSRACVASC